VRLEGLGELKKKSDNCTPPESGNFMFEQKINEVQG
jgi:hypothetical protein